MASKNNIDITVVVSGQNIKVTVNLHQKVSHLVDEALNNSGNKGQPSGSWELRTADGTLIDQSLTIEQAGITDGITLFLNPHAGAGGSE
jgi:hypothetical protein